MKKLATNPPPKERVVYKYPFPLANLIELGMPEGAEILKVAEQHGQLCMWALGDRYAPTVLRRFSVYGTGWPIDNLQDLRHIETFMQDGTTYVWHLFERVGGHRNPPWRQANDTRR